jgi:hypothetical protein
LHTIASVMMTKSKKLLLIKGITEAKLAKILECSKQLQSFGFKTGKELMMDRKTIVHVSTGSKSLDDSECQSACSIVRLFARARV